MTLGELAERIEATVVGDPDIHQFIRAIPGSFNDDLLVKRHRLLVQFASFLETEPENSGAVLELPGSNLEAPSDV